MEKISLNQLYYFYPNCFIPLEQAYLGPQIEKIEDECLKAKTQTDVKVFEQTTTMFSIIKTENFDKVIDTNNCDSKLNFHLEENLNTHQKVDKTLEMLEQCIQQQKKCNMQYLSTTELQHSPTQSLFKRNSLQKKHLFKLWVTRLYNYYKVLDLDFPKEEIIFFKKFASKLNISKSSFIQFLFKCQNIRFALFHHYFENDKPIAEICKTNLRTESKFILIQSYMIMKNALIAPQTFTTMSNPKLIKTMQAQELEKKCLNKDLNEIKQIVYEQLQKVLHQFKGKKCSMKNNITHAWTTFIREIVRQKGFISLATDELLTKIKIILESQECIQTMQTLLSIPQLNSYLKRQKIDNQCLIRSVIANPNLNILIKYNLLLTYDRFREALDYPLTLRCWTGRQ